MLLATRGVKSPLVSALPTTSIMPKAHVLNQRTMEVFSDVGVADAIYARGTPPAQMSHPAWYLDVCGVEDAGRTIHEMECWDGGCAAPAWVAASPCRQANLPQIRLEPLLRARAEELNPGRVLHGHELLSLVQDGQGVTATIRDRSAGTEYEVRADYLLGCDGGRTVGRLIGVQLEGPRDIMRSVSVHMTADLSRWLRDDDVLIRWIVHTRPGGPLSVLVPMGPDHWGPKSEEWVFHMNYPPELEPEFETDDMAIAVMRERLRIPNLQPKVHIVTRWRLEGLVAPTTKRRRGRARPRARRRPGRTPRRRLARPAARLPARPPVRPRRRDPRASRSGDRLALDGPCRRSPARARHGAGPGAGPSIGRMSQPRAHRRAPSTSHLSWAYLFTVVGLFLRTHF